MKGMKLSIRQKMISVFIPFALTLIVFVVALNPKYESLGMFLEPGMILAVFFVPVHSVHSHALALVIVTGIANVILYTLGIRFALKCGLLLRKRADRSRVG